MEKHILHTHAHSLTSSTPAHTPSPQAHTTHTPSPQAHLHTLPHLKHTCTHSLTSSTPAYTPSPQAHLHTPSPKGCVLLYFMILYHIKEMSSKQANVFILGTRNTLENTLMLYKHMCMLCTQTCVHNMHMCTHTCTHTYTYNTHKCTHTYKHKCTHI